MDEDDLFGVFDAKPKSFAAASSTAPSAAGGSDEATGEDTRKRKKEEDGDVDAARDDLGKDDDDEEGAEPPVKKRDVEPGEELCPAAGEGSVEIHDITSFNPELGRKAHRHQVSLLRSCHTLKKYEELCAFLPWFACSDSNIRQHA